MSTPRITVGLPVYKGADLIAKTLCSLQQQTFGNFQAIISVDGGDEETAAACRPFLTDPRFQLIIHSDRLDWIGNFNWLLRQDLHEFFCYQQHDDTVAPEFFETLLRAADEKPNAAAIYADCRYSGKDHEFTEVYPSIEGESLHRMFKYVQLVWTRSAVPLRGLIRREAIKHAGAVRSDEFRAVLQIFGWLAKLLQWGTFQRVAEPIYYKLYRPNSVGHDVHLKQAAWPTMFTTLLDAAIPVCDAPQARLFMQQAIIDQVVANPYFFSGNDANSSSAIIARCMDRLRDEGNSHLLTTDEVPAVLHGQDYRLEMLSPKRSRFRKALYRSGQAYRLGKIIYPRSPTRRVRYQIRHSRDMLRHAMSLLNR